MSRPPQVCWVFALGWLMIGFGLGHSLCYFFSMSRTIDRRAMDLGLMQYSAAEDKMVPKPEYFEILTYLKNGSMK